MRICHISFSFTIGGIENLVVDIVNEQSRNHCVYLIVVNNRYDQEILNRISKKVRLILINRPQGNRWNFSYVFKLWMMLFKINPAIIHCHTHNLITILQPFKSKCIYTVHEVGVSLNYLHRYKQIFSISNAVRSDLKSRGMQNSTLIFNGINFFEFMKRQYYSLEKYEDFKLVQISRLHEKKGPDILIKAIHKLVYEFNIKQISLDIIGDGPAQRQLETLIENYNLHDYVTLKGPRDRAWIYDHLCDYHILIQPSRSEGFGLTLIEAVAAGLPVIASNIDGPAEIMENVSSAFMFETEHISELALTIVKVVEEYKDGRIEEKCKEAFREIENKFSVSSVARSYLKHYAEPDHAG